MRPSRAPSGAGAAAAPALFSLACLGCLGCLTSACAPKPEASFAEIRELRIVTVSPTWPRLTVATGPADDTHPLYTFVESPPPNGIAVVFADPRVWRAPGTPLELGGKAVGPLGEADPRARVGVEIRVCRGGGDICVDAGLDDTLRLFAEASPGEDTVSVPLLLTRERLNDWLAQDPWGGAADLRVTVDVRLRNGAGEERRAVTALRYGPPLDDAPSDGEVAGAARGAQFRLKPDGEPIPLSPASIAVRFPESPVLEVDGPHLWWEDPVLSGRPGERDYRSAVRFVQIVDIMAVGFPGGRPHAPIDNGSEYPFALPMPERADQLPATVYIVVHNPLGGSAWARWTLVPAPPLAPRDHSGANISSETSGQ